jgi:tetratricopeptide (TPR) repeat protein
MTRITCLVLTLLLAACAGQVQEESAIVPVVPQPPAEPAPVAERPIPPDSVYDLLVAEFALRRQEYDLALDRYLELAPVLRDPGVSAHTTHLAQFQRREADAFAAVSLWTELEPDNVEANSTLALLLARQGNTVAAADHLAAVARNGGRANFPVLLNGFAQLSPQQQSQLTASINALAEEFPQDPELLLAQALLLDELGREEQAVEKLQALFELEPQNNQAVLLEAKLLQETGARRPLRRLEATLDEEPANSKLRLQYARMLTRDDMEAAREQFEILASQAPEDSQLLLSLALINREIGDNLTAKAYLRRMLELRQQEGQAHFFLGQIAEDDGEVESALYNYTKVTDGREFFSASARIGQIYIDTARLGQFSAYFNQLRSRYPDRSERLYGIEADLLSRSGDIDQAVAVLTRGLDELPQSASMRYTRAMLGEQQDNLALLESDLRAIIAQDPDNATALNALGYTLADRTQRYDEARTLISRALTLQPQEPAILDSMGWVLYRQGDYQESIRYLRLAYERFPDPEVAAHLGEVLWASGDTKAAMAIWEQALEKDPDHPVLVSTIRRLRSREPGTAS